MAKRPQEPRIVSPRSAAPISFPLVEEPDTRYEKVAAAARKVMQEDGEITVRLVQRNPLKALRYSKDGMNVEAVCRFIRHLGGEFDGFTSGNHLYVYKIRDDWNSRTEVFPGEWIVGPVKGGITVWSDERMHSDFEQVNGGKDGQPWAALRQIVAQRALDPTAIEIAERALDEGGETP